MLAASLAVLAEGCSTQSGPGSTQSGGTSWSPVCPDSLPTQYSSCSNPLAQPPCEYGNAWWDPGCDTIVECSFGNTWNVVEVSSETCFAAPAPNSADCPHDRSAVGVGTACDHNGLTCYYDEGTACECGAARADAGTTWQCNPDPGCPMPRPRFGASCNREQTCTYGVAPNVIGEQCIDGFWQPPTTYDPPTAPPPASGFTECPPDPAIIGGACAMHGLTCHYGDATCECLGSNSPDAGSFWGCNPPPGCPNPFPGLGASCYAGTGCIYGEGNNLRCVQCPGGSWQTGSGPCPNGGP